MKKILCLIAFLAGAVFCQSTLAQEGQYIEKQIIKKQQEQETSYQTCDGERALSIASFVTNPPFGWVEWINAAQPYYENKGFNIDFIKKIANENKIYVESRGYPTDEDTWAAFRDGKIDILVGVYYDPKMKLAGYAYVIPSLIQNVITVVFMKGKEKDIRRFEDLEGMKGIVRTDEGFYQYVRLLIPQNVQIEEVHDSREAFTKLLTGEADYLLTSPYSAEAEARRFKMNLNISMVPIPLLGQEQFLLVSNQTPCPHLVQKIAIGLHEKRKDMHAVKRELVHYIDEWGQRFKNAPALADQLKNEGLLLEQSNGAINPNPSESEITTSEQTNNL